MEATRKSTMDSLREADELKSYRTVKGMLSKFIKKFLAVYQDVYEDLYENGDDNYEEAVEMFDKLLKDKSWNLFIGLCATQRGDIFSSDREATAFVLAVQKFFGNGKLTESYVASYTNKIDANLHFDVNNKSKSTDEFIALVKDTEDTLGHMDELLVKFNNLKGLSSDLEELLEFMIDFILSINTNPLYTVKSYLSGMSAFSYTRKKVENWYKENY